MLPTQAEGACRIMFLTLAKWVQKIVIDQDKIKRQKRNKNENVNDI